MSSSTSSSRNFFFSFVVIGFLGSLIFIIASEILVRELVVPKSDYENYRNKLRANISPYVAFGDSHGANAMISSEQFTNFSYAGDTLETLAKKTRHYVNNTKPKGIVLPADPHFFSNYRLQKDQSALLGDLLRNDQPVITFLRPPFRQYLLAYWKKTITDLIQPSSSVSKTKTEVQSITKLDPDKVKAETQIRTQLHKPVKHFSRTRHAKIFVETLRSFEGQNIDVCLVAFPTTTEYRQSMARYSSVSQVDQYFASLSSLENVKYFDMRESSPDKYFSDVDHLNAFGARLATAQILASCFGL